MTGRLAVIGIGPGNNEQLTLEAQTEIARARHFFGYQPYLDQLELGPGQTSHPSDNREELSRAGAALEMANQGLSVAMISAGDPGVFAMAAAVCEAIEFGPKEWRDIHIEIIPGITAMLAVAARVGAPLGHDFCAISLSNNLKPWDVIEGRLRACASAGLVIALYNPASKARPWQLHRAFEVLGEFLPPETLIVFGRAAGRPDEHITTTTLAEADAGQADMATCVIIGSTETRLIERPDKNPLIYSPRSSRGRSK